MQLQQGVVRVPFSEKILNEPFWLTRFEGVKKLDYLPSAPLLVNAKIKKGVEDEICDDQNGRHPNQE